MFKKNLELTRQKSYSAINSAMVEAYWLVGKRIVEEEQNGEERAEYGKFIIKSLAKELTENLGKCFSERSIREYRQFYLLFPEFLSSENQGIVIRRTVFAKLSWSHFQKILKIQHKIERNKQIFNAQFE